MVFLGRDGNRGCQLVGLAVKDVGTENCRVTVAAVEGHSKESKDLARSNSCLDRIVRLQWDRRRSWRYGDMAGVLVGDETRGGG